MHPMLTDPRLAHLTLTLDATPPEPLATVGFSALDAGLWRYWSADAGLLAHPVGAAVLVWTIAAAATTVSTFTTAG